MKIGPKMYQVVSYVSDHPGCPKLHAAEYVGPHGSRSYGYQTVNRAIRAGLIEARVYPSGTYALHLPRKPLTESELTETYSID